METKFSYRVQMRTDRGGWSTLTTGSKAYCQGYADALERHKGLKCRVVGGSCV